VSMAEELAKKYADNTSSPVWHDICLALVNETIERCAQECDSIVAECDRTWLASGTIAKLCSDRIRALKSTPPPAGGKGQP